MNWNTKVPVLLKCYTFEQRVKGASSVSLKLIIKRDVSKSVTKFSNCQNKEDRGGMGMADGSLGPVWYDLYSFLSVMAW